MKSDDDYGEQLDTVYFPISCNEVARRHAERGLALLHHMTYKGARAEFDAAIKVDPDCDGILGAIDELYPSVVVGSTESNRFRERSNTFK